jgi:protein KRI1
VVDSLLKKDKDNMNEEEKKDYLENLLDEFYNIEYEDIIGGGSVKTRFRYRKVAQADFGLTDEEILLLEDKQLNRLVSLKKYRPYAGEEGVNPEDEVGNG